VPFFIYNCPFAQGLSRGDRVKPLRMCSNLKLWHVLVVPKIRVSTPLIYKRWDMKYPGLVKKAGLTKPKYSVNILISALKKKDIPLIDKALFNNLERVTAELYPQVTHIKDKLKCLGLKSILMSGSGPAIFCITSSGKEAVSLGRQLEKGHSSWQVFVTRTI
jgi:4-diphosphocytidyl-2-C-methyl-D-erythritol kinase